MSQALHRAAGVYHNLFGRRYAAAATLGLTPAMTMSFACTLISIDPFYCGQEELFFEEDAYDPPTAA